MAGPRTRFYVDKQKGKIKGVCAGFAEYFGMDVTWVRLLALGSLTVLGPLSIIAYFVAASSATERPPELEREVARQDVEEKEFWKKVRRNPRATARSIRARFRDIDRRLAQAEAYLTSPDKRLAREIDGLR
jgi:phage shock protein C